MARSLNKVMLIGNLGQDPEIRTTPNGAQVANFSIACSESWNDQSGQKQERTEWVRIVAWRKLAEIIQQYVRKGSKVYVEGKLQTRSWDDTKSGEKRYSTEVVIDQLIMLDGNKGGNEGGGHGGGSRPTARQSNGNDGDGFDPDFVPAGATPGAGADDDLPFKADDLP